MLGRGAVPRHREDAARRRARRPARRRLRAATSCCALLAHYELRRGVDRARTAALARRALAGGTLERESTQGSTTRSTRCAAPASATPAAGYASALAARRARGDLLDVGGLLGFRGWLLLDRGDLRAAEPDVRESIEFSRSTARPAT